MEARRQWNHTLKLSKKITVHQKKEKKKVTINQESCVCKVVVQNESDIKIFPEKQKQRI
jgi:hypothetical protein